MSQAEAIIAAVVAGLLILLPVVANFIVAIRNKQAIEQVHVLVNQQATSVLQEVADLRARVAELSGTEADRALAKLANEKASIAVAKAAVSSK